jgi:ABC-2 type transport system ATP-binding protein
MSISQKGCPGLVFLGISLRKRPRREFLQGLMDAVAARRLSVVLSPRLVAGLERVCDYVIVLAASRVRVAGQVSDLLAAHTW